jgi:hypothetical protein
MVCGLAVYQVQSPAHPPESRGVYVGAAGRSSGSRVILRAAFPVIDDQWLPTHRRRLQRRVRGGIAPLFPIKTLAGTGKTSLGDVTAAVKFPAPILIAMDRQS